MSKTRTKIGWKLIILLIVSAAFVLSRFGLVAADEVDTEKATVVIAQVDNFQSKTEPTQTPVIATDDDESLVGPMLKLMLALIAVVGGIYGFLIVLRKMMGSKFSTNKGNRLL